MTEEILYTNANVNLAIDATKRIKGDYFDNLCMAELVQRKFGYYPGISDVWHLETALRAADWKAETHVQATRAWLSHQRTVCKPANFTRIPPSCQAYRTDSLSGATTWIIIKNENGYNIVDSFFQV